MIQHAQEIDLDTIVDFCKKSKQTEAAKEMMVSCFTDGSARADNQLVAIQAMNVLFRQNANDQFRNVGAQGRRFFGTGELSSVHKHGCGSLAANAVPLPDGGVVYSGFMQYVWLDSRARLQAHHQIVPLDRIGPSCDAARHGLLGLCPSRSARRCRR